MWEPPMGPEKAKNPLKSFRIRKIGLSLFSDSRLHPTTTYSTSKVFRTAIFLLHAKILQRNQSRTDKSPIPYEFHI